MVYIVFAVLPPITQLVKNPQQKDSARKNTAKTTEPIITQMRLVLFLLFSAIIYLTNFESIVINLNVTASENLRILSPVAFSILSSL